MYVGVDYYPEHWPKSRWETDAKLMKEAGFNIVRLFEFNWVNMEPSEGQYVFDSVDEPVELLGKYGISVIMCTPTAVMPAWVARKYPDTLFMKKDGTRDTWGVRKNCCLTSPTYRLLSERITMAMADHFAHNKNIIGWQTDNEFGHPFCYCDSCRIDFQNWLQRKYKILDELNRAWGTHFWGHRVQQWAEITIPTDTGSHNPSACLDWHRYFSFQNVRFQHEQVKILREKCTDHFVTHNLMGTFPEINYFDLSEDLDFVSWDSYPIWAMPYIRHDTSLVAALMRSVKKKNFWIMEQSAGPGGWGAFARNVWPGELRSVGFQHLANGADGQLWFRWRSCTAGREQYWHGLLGHDGEPLRRYNEAKQIAHEYHKIAPEVEGTTVKADVAFVYDYDSYWVLRFQAGFDGNDYINNMKKYHEGLFRAGVGVDIISVKDDFTKYKLVIAPELHVMSDETAAKIRTYVENGGVFMTDFRTAVKDPTNLCWDRTLPGKLSDILGITIEEYESLKTFPVKVFGETFTGEKYADWTTAKTAEVIGRYDDWHLDAFAAVTRNKFGKGAAWYVGAPVQEPHFYDKLADKLLEDAKLTPDAKPPKGVEFAVREGNGKKLFFIINHDTEPKTVQVPSGKTELLSGKTTTGTIELDRFAVAVIKM